eukprot:gene1970-2421_t
MAERRITELLWEKLTITDDLKSKSKLTSSSTTTTTTIIPSQPKTRLPIKKKKSNRDSLAFRESPGKPGSRKYKRYMNTQFLKDGGSLKDKFQAEMDFTLIETKKTLLFYQDQPFKKHWEPFHEITYDKQQEIISSLSPEADIKPEKQHNINTRFAKLRKSLRPLFKQPFLHNSYFITTAEQKLIAFWHDIYAKQIEVFIPDSYQRLLLHGLVSYYSLFSKSFTSKDGQRITVISKPKVMPPFPDLSLTEYLLNENQKSNEERQRQKLRRQQLNQKKFKTTRKTTSSNHGSTTNDKVVTANN